MALQELISSRKVRQTTTQLIVTMVFKSTIAEIVGGADGWVGSTGVTIPKPGDLLSATVPFTWTGLTASAYTQPVCVTANIDPRSTKATAYYVATYIGQAVWV